MVYTCFVESIAPILNGFGLTSRDDFLEIALLLTILADRQKLNNRSTSAIEMFFIGLKGKSKSLLAVDYHFAQNTQFFVEFDQQHQCTANYFGRTDFDKYSLLGPERCRVLVGKSSESYLPICLSQV